MAETETEVAVASEQSPETPAAPPVKPAKKIRGVAGEKLPQTIDSKVAAPKPLKTAVQIAAENEAAQAEKFPDNFKDALALLKKLSAEPVIDEEEWQAKQPRLNALKAHVFRVQQGLLPSPSKANDHASVWVKRNEDAKRTKLEILGRSHPEVKELLIAHDALKKQLEDLTKTETK